MPLAQTGNGVHEVLDALLVDQSPGVPDQGRPRRTGPGRRDRSRSGPPGPVVDPLGTTSTCAAGTSNSEVTWSRM
ncbi:hypothetical protein NKG94_49720 [Micromonospora sp. M12]